MRFKYIALLAMLGLLWLLQSAFGAERHLRLVVTGNLHGYLSACQCPKGQPGGLARRKTIFDRIRFETPEAVFIDVGRLTGKTTERGEGENLLELMDWLEYDYIHCYPVDAQNLLDSKLEIWLWKWMGSFLPTQFRFSTGYHGIPFDYGQFVDLDFRSDSAYLRLEPPPFSISFISPFAEDSSRLDSMRWDRGWERAVTKLYHYLRTHPDPMALKVNYPDKLILTVLAINLGAEELEDGLAAWLEEQRVLASPALPGDSLDLVIAGGGGFIDAEVVKENGVLYAYPGLYGGFVLVLDLWTENGQSISRYEWEAIPTETAEPDELFDVRLNQLNSK